MDDDLIYFFRLSIRGERLKVQPQRAKEFPFKQNGMHTGGRVDNDKITKREALHVHVRRYCWYAHGQPLFKLKEASALCSG